MIQWLSFLLLVFFFFFSDIVDIHACLLSHVQFFATSWTVASQSPLSMTFLRQKYWHGLSFPSPGNLPDAEIEPTSPVSSALEAGIL